MREKRASLEVIAPSVEEAVARGLEDLGLPPEAVDVEVLDPGSKGLFGLGSRQARVRLTIKSASQKPTPTPAAEPASPAINEPVKEKTAPPAREAVEEVEQEPSPATGEISGLAPEPVSISEPTAAEISEEEDNTLRIARDTVMDLLDRMKVNAHVTSRYGEAEDVHSKAPVMVDIHGEDLSILIGRKAETLNALQYIASLIVGKELERSIPLVVDVEGYRARREQQIRQLARRMADQAIKTGRRQVLEPMPANERRLVHIELRNNPNVTTQSIGEEPRRKVTIVPER